MCVCLRGTCLVQETKVSMTMRLGFGVRSTVRLVWFGSLLTCLFLGMSWGPRSEAGEVTLWSTLRDANSITTPDIGPSGTYGGGAFVYDGELKRDVLRVTQGTQMLVTFPRAVINASEGSLEFDAKLNGFPNSLGWGMLPYFVKITDGTNAWSVGFNGNDGQGNGGVVGQAGLNTAGTGLFKSSGSVGGWTYHDAISAAPDQWQHYKLVWNDTGIAKLPPNQPGPVTPNSGPIKQVLAIYVNGVLNSTRWQTNYVVDGYTPLPNPYPLELNGGTLGLVLSSNWGTGESVDMANLRIEKTPEPSTLILCAVACGALVLLKRRRPIGGCLPGRRQTSAT